MEKTNILKLALTLTGGMLLGTIFIVLAISWTGPTAAPPGGFTGTLITEDPIFIDGRNVGIGTMIPMAKLDIANVEGLPGGTPLGQNLWFRIGDGGDLGRIWMEYGPAAAPLFVLSGYC